MSVLLSLGATQLQRLFYTLLVLHVAAALTGFASIGFAGTYAGRAAQFGGAVDGPGPVTDLAGPASDLAGEAADGSFSAAPAGMTTEELVRYFRRPAGLWWALLAVPWLGLGALAAEPHGGGVAQAWDLAAFGLWLAAALVAALVVVPAVRRVGAALVPPGAGAALVPPAAGPLTTAPPTTATLAIGPPATGLAGLDSATRGRVAHSGLVASRAAAVCDVLFLMALALMIWQP
jgi:hypothetical protein